MTENGTNQILGRWGWRVSLFLFGIVFTLGGVWIVHPVSEEDVQKIIREEVAQLIEATGPYSRERSALLARLDRSDQDRFEMTAKLEEINKVVQRVEVLTAAMSGSLEAFLGRANVRH